MLWFGYLKMNESKLFLGKKIGVFCFFLAVLCILTCSGCGKTDENVKAEQNGSSVSDTGFFLDTAVTITLYDWSEEETIQKAFAEIQRLEQLLSVELEDSEAAAISAGAGKQSAAVSEETLEVVKTAQTYAEKSGGKFDITIGPLISLWNIHDGTGYVPKAEEREAAKALVGYEDLTISGNRVFLRRDGMALNLGAIAKGYVSDRVKDLLKREGVEHAVINLGGNVAVIGGKPDGTPFKIGVQDPFGETGEIIGMIELEDVSLISSGNYERYFEQDGVRYHHILDPDSGAPAEAGLSAVTVLTEKGIDGDALSTSVFLLGAEKGLELVKSIEGAEALLVDADGTITMTDGLKEKWTAYE